MEKIIKIVMTENKAINILVNNVVKHTIQENERSITAQKIFEIFDYQQGDTFVIAMENEKKLDESVMDFFKGLLDDIVSKVNEMPVVNLSDDELDL